MHESVPTLPRKDMEFRLHGEEWTDPYEWVRGETEEALRLDLFYVENWTFLMDLKILLRTVKVVLTQEGSA